MRHIEAQLIHDMTNAATVIRGAVETLRNSARPMEPEVLDDITAMLERRTDMLVRLLEDLATLNAMDRGDLGLLLQQVNLAETLLGVVEDNRSRVAGTFTVSIDPDAIVYADPVRLVQILDNLLSNASRYGGDNVSLGAWREGKVVRIAVVDDGPGVPPELVGSLFDLYSRGTASRQLGGSGLGLAIVQHLCRVCGGSVEYDDSNGTTFTVTLPAAPSAEGLSGSIWVDADGLVDAETE